MVRTNSVMSVTLQYLKFAKAVLCRNWHVVHLAPPTVSECITCAVNKAETSGRVAMTEMPFTLLQDTVTSK